MTKKIKSILITGASRGLGYSLSRILSQDGHKVYAGARKLTRHEKKLSIKNLQYIQLDITSESSISSCINTIIKNEKKIDILINNAAKGLIGPVDSASKMQVKNIFDLNVFGSLNITQEVIPHMRTQESGQIVFISSTAGIESSSYFGLYSATKFAIEALAFSLATTLFLWNIKVSVIQPGAMSTKFCDYLEKGDFYSKKKEPYKNFTQKSINFLKMILKQGQDPNEVAKIILKHINNKNDYYRIQTNNYSKIIAKKHLNDSDGKKIIEEHKNLIKSWFD